MTDIGSDSQLNMPGDLGDILQGAINIYGEAAPVISDAARVGNVPSVSAIPKIQGIPKVNTQKNSMYVILAVLVLAVLFLRRTH